MPLRNLARKVKFGKILKVKAAPRWCDIRKFGLKRIKTRRINVFKKRWRKVRVKV